MKEHYIVDKMKSLDYVRKQTNNLNDMINNISVSTKRSLILVVIAASCIMAGGLSAWLSHRDDGPIEEMAESVLEDEIETILALPRDELDGTIDFTPSSRERG